MLILSIDTTADFGSIALLQDREVLAEMLLHAPQGFSHVLFDRIAAMLRDSGVELADVQLYAAASGPGSFTGVRVGLAAAKGLAEVHGRPVIAVSNLRALASFGTLPLRATLIDARRGEVYAALYDNHGLTVIEEQVVAFPRFVADLRAELPEGEIEWICADFTPFDTGQRYVLHAPRALATAIGIVALDTFQGSPAGLSPEVFPPEAIDANYVRRSDAELLWKQA